MAACRERGDDAGGGFFGAELPVPVALVEAERHESVVGGPQQQRRREWSVRVGGGDELDDALLQPRSVRCAARGQLVAALEQQLVGPETAAAIALDVTDAVAAQRAVETAVERFGVPDVIVTNAGRADIESIADAELSSLRAIVATNLWGVVNVVKAALPLLRAAGRGHLVQISSVSGRLAPAPGLGPCVAAKFAAEGFLEAIALEVAPFGIRVTMIEPGRMATTIASSMRIPEPSTPYAPLAAAWGNGATRGVPPAAAARFVLEITELDRPPLRVPPGAEPTTAN